MPQLKCFGKLDNERELFFLSLSDFASLPEAVSIPGRHFVAFLAANANEIDASVLSEFAHKLVLAGCVYFCAWGKDCERMHDLFDLECLQIDPVVMTTWHANDSLDEALYFFVFSAHPDDGYGNTTKSMLAISIGDSAQDKKMCDRLADVRLLNKDVLGSD
jgi:hypothetical protein